MLDLTEQYFQDKVCCEKSKEDFLQWLSDEQPILVPCEYCAWPSTIHSSGDKCTQMKEAQQRCPFAVYQNLTKVLQEEMMKRNVMRNMTQEQASQSTDMDLKKFLSKHQKQQNLFLEKLWEKKTVESSVPKTTKLMKTSKPPIWTKDMTFDSFKKQISRWNEKEKEVSKTERFHEVVESLKLNKEIKGLAKYLK